MADTRSPPETPAMSIIDRTMFEIDKRKRRGKRKKWPKPLTIFKDAEPDQPDGQPIYQTDDSDSNVDSNNGDSDRETKNVSPQIIHGVRIIEFNAGNSGNSSTSMDGQMKTSPQVFSPEEFRLENLEYQSRKESITESQGSEVENIIEKLNVRALPKHASTYQLENFEKNALLVFNQTNIQGYKKPRLGTEKDVAELERTFKGFGFEVETEEDLTRHEIMEKLKEFSSRDFTDYGCVAVAVLTHGSKHGLIRAKDLQYSELEIVKHLQVINKPTLVTKPKLVIIQACRGTESIEGVPVRAQGKIMKDLDDEVEPYTLPVESDMLILHSSYIGKPSHRDELHGSWFIQSLCRKINQLASTMDFESILTEVKREVAIDKSHVEHNRRTYETNINKQMPVCTSTLIRKLYLRRFGEEAPASTPAQPAGQQTDNSVLDNVATLSTPTTPLLVQFGPCSCFLEHFKYILTCLKFFLEEFPDDATARSYLRLAETFDDEVSFNSSKECMAKLICDHLRKAAGELPHFKFLYYYKH